MSSVYRVSEELTLSYAAPILSRQHPDTEGINSALEHIILGRERNETGMQASNAGGWHSKPDVCDWPHPEVRQLVSWIGAASNTLASHAFAEHTGPGEVDLSAWANVVRRGHYVRPHAHPGWDWSGVYYVNAGQRPTGNGRGGVIEFLDPRCGAGMLNSPGHPFTGTVQFYPRNGLLLLFPSWLSHYVHPYQGAGCRISIAFNMQVVSTVNR